MEFQNEVKIGNKIIKYRNWKVKDRRELKEEIQNIEDVQEQAKIILKHLVFNCLDKEYALNQDEIQYLFSQIRKTSLDDKIYFTYKCEKCQTENKKTINIDKIYQIKFGNLETIVENDVKIELQEVKNIQYYNENIYKDENIDFYLHIKSINDNESMSLDEIRDFFDNLETKTMDKILSKYKKMIFTISKIHTFECEKCKNKEKFYFDEIPGFLPKEWFLN